MASNTYVLSGEETLHSQEGLEMPRYRVILSALLEQQASIEVEANDSVQAEKLALDQPDEMDWKDIGYYGSPGDAIIAVACEEL